MCDKKKKRIKFISLTIYVSSYFYLPPVMLCIKYKVHVATAGREETEGR